MENGETFEIIGVVEEVKQLSGSYRNIKLQGQDQVFTTSNNNLIEVDKIVKLKGVYRNNLYLTENWDFV